MTRRFSALAIATSLVAAALALPSGTAAVSSAPVPSSMAAVGDSITQAASSGGSLGADAPQNSWSTGTSTTVNSHLLRLRQLNANLVAYNRSVSGAKVADLHGQMLTVVELDPDPGYLTVLIGGNDLCTDTVAQMTSVGDFREHFAAAMDTITKQSPGTYVYVVSIPDVWQLWNLFKNNFWARLVWSSAKICQSLLANPTSTHRSDVERREQVRQRNRDYNTQLAEVCALYGSRCHFDDHAVFDTQFTKTDVSGDYFHPSVAGQAKLAKVSWDAGYQWVTEPPPPNQAPIASFTFECADLTCDFTDTSTDEDGVIAGWHWSFGDGETSSLRDPSHTYAAAGTYTVSLTITDDRGATAATSASVNATAPPDPPPSDPPESDAAFVTALSGSSSDGKGQVWTATVTISVGSDAGPIDGATVTGTWSTGGASSCTTSGAGSCTVSTSVNGRKATSTTLEVTDIAAAGFTYDSSQNTQTTIIVAR